MTTVLRFKRKKTEDPLSAIVVAYKKSRASDYCSETPEKGCQDNVNDGLENELETKKEVFRLCVSTETVETSSVHLGLRKVLQAARRSEKESGSKTAIQLANLRCIGKNNNSSEVLADGFESILTEDFDMEDACSSNEVLTKLNGELTEGENRNVEVKSSGIVCNGTEMLRIPHDLHPQSRSDQVTESSISPSEYVYDYYYSSGMSNADFLSLENWLGVEPFQDSTTEEILDNAEQDEDSDRCEDYDDSNDEANWRNDYPEEEEDSESDASSKESWEEEEGGFKTKAYGKSQVIDQGIIDDMEDMDMQGDCSD